MPAIMWDPPRPQTLGVPQEIDTDSLLGGSCFTGAVAQNRHLRRRGGVASPPVGLTAESSFARRVDIVSPDALAGHRAGRVDPAAPGPLACPRGSPGASSPDAGEWNVLTRSEEHTSELQ